MGSWNIRTGLVIVAVITLRLCLFALCSGERMSFLPVAFWILFARRVSNAGP